MALSDRRTLFGIHSITPYSRTDGLPYGIAKVIGTAEVALAGELVELFGGSSKFSWSVQDGTIKSDVNLTLKEYPDFLFQLFLGKSVTSNAAEASGSVTALTNKKGTSVQKATTGIASISVLTGSEADVKFANLVIKAASATTVDVYLASDVDIVRGTDGVYQNDLLKITATPLTITTGADTNIPSFGLKLTGGSGTIAFVSGDTATSQSRPINTASIDVTIGASADSNPEFGLIVIGEKEGSGQMVELDIFRCKGVGLPFPFGEKKFLESSIAIKAFYDATKDGVFKLRQVEPSTFV